jgi:hypothetical protein
MLTACGPDTPTRPVPVHPGRRAAVWDVPMRFGVHFGCILARASVPARSAQPATGCRSRGPPRITTVRPLPAGTVFAALGPTLFGQLGEKLRYA